MPYVGSNQPNPMQLQACPACGHANPGVGNCPNMACGVPLRQPFVAVHDIGQGNCNALVDAQGRVKVLFDFGYATAANMQPEPDFEPCLCDRPTIILSHWDADHINLAKTVKKALTLHWIVPEQAHSAFAGRVQDGIRAAGGSMCVVPRPRGNLRHLIFPWGFVECCTATRGVNGTGLAAWVCVADTQAATVARHAVPGGLALRPIDRPADRARQAAAALHGRVLALVGGGAQPQARVEAFARPLAIAFAASQTITGRQPHMPIQECVDAAIRAAMRVRVHGANTSGAITGNGGFSASLPTLQGHKPAWAAAARAELAAAAIAARRVEGFAARVAAIIPELTFDGKVPADVRHWLVRDADRPVPALPAFRGGLAPMRPWEAYILLNGDANFSVIPSVARADVPRVVGMTAMHHGAVYEDSEAIDGSAMPFAPGSRAAKAVLRFPRRLMGGGSCIAAVAKAAQALKRRHRGANRELRTLISRVARAAAAAVVTVETAYPNEVVASPARFAQVAAAAAVAAWRHRDPRIVGVAAALAATAKKVGEDTDSSPIQGLVDLAAEAVEAELAGAPLDARQMTRAARGGVDGALLQSPGHDSVLTIISNDAVQNGQIPLTADNAGANAETAFNLIVTNFGNGLNAKKKKNARTRLGLSTKATDNQDIANVVNDVASAATAAVLHYRRTRNDRRRRENRVDRAVEEAWDALGTGVLVPAGTAATLRAALRFRHDHAYPNTAAGVAGFAAQLAAERTAAYLVGTTVEAIRVVCRAGRTRLGRKRAARALMARRRTRRKALLAYSYGVHRTTHEHCFEVVTAGNMGHPHPYAIAKYEAHGWTRRGNASRRAARYPAAQADSDASHPRGDLALSWDSVDNEPLGPGVIEHRCASCGLRRRFQR